MAEPEKVNLASMDIAEEKREQLKALFPEAFTEGKVDFEQLKRALGEWVEPGKERFGLTWPGKAECMKIIQQPSVATLRPARDESVNFDETQNLFIEGDNLEVLKLLQKSYFGKVKMIYIDPPYNTGKEFIYPDKFAETLDTYLEYTGQKDSEGRKFSTNTDAQGRYHSNWLNMMYPRLYLARNLLREDGVIFINIDDSEQANLKLLCDQVFGEENFIADVIWEKRFTRNNDAKLMSSVFDHVLLYRKSDEVSHMREPRTEKANSIYSNPDNDPRGDWTSVSYISQRTKEQRPNLTYKIKNPHTGEEIEHEVNAWKYSKEKYEEHAKEGRLHWGKDGNNQYPRLKRYLSELDDGIVPINLWNYKDTGTLDDGTKTVNTLIGKDIFDYPKPISLIQRMMLMATKNDEEAIILDFFAGSGSAAHAVIDLNKEDGGNRKFIMVQLPEPTDEKSEAFTAGYKTIADISKERIRRAAKNIADEQNGQLDLNGSGALDLGFRVFKLARSNFKVWEGDVEAIQNLEQRLFEHIDHINDSSTPEDILYELLLKSGFPLTTKVETLELAGKQVFSIEDGAMLICLDKALTQEVIDAMADADPLQVICLDDGFKGNDQLKANAVQTFKARAQDDESAIVFRTV